MQPNVGYNAVITVCLLLCFVLLLLFVVMGDVVVFVILMKPNNKMKAKLNLIVLEPKT